MTQSSKPSRLAVLKALNRFLEVSSEEMRALLERELQGSTSARPLTHDLLKNVIHELGAKIVSIVVSDLVDEVYYARIVLDVAGRHVEIDSRPSDAIALAVRAKTPIYVEDSILEHAGVTLEQEEPQKPASKSETEAEDEDDTDNLDAYRDFINSLDVLDEFGKD